MICGIMLGNEGSAGPLDMAGCLLPGGHSGPHEFADERGKPWLWEANMECTCAHCMRCEGDYCTTYWRKPAVTKKGDANV